MTTAIIVQGLKLISCHAAARSREHSNVQSARWHELRRRPTSCLRLSGRLSPASEEVAVMHGHAVPQGPVPVSPECPQELMVTLAGQQW